MKSIIVIGNIVIEIGKSYFEEKLQITIEEEFI
jgi:hypothetical protein